MYNPCLECYSKYGRTYSVACDKMCDYAKAIQACHQWQIVCREWRGVADYGDKHMGLSKRLEATLNEEQARILRKEGTTDGK